MRRTLAPAGGRNEVQPGASFRTVVPDAGPERSTTWPCPTAPRSAPEAVSSAHRRHGQPAPSRMADQGAGALGSLDDAEGSPGPGAGRRPSLGGRPPRSRMWGAPGRGGSSRRSIGRSCDIGGTVPKGVWPRADPGSGDIAAPRRSRAVSGLARTGRKGAMLQGSEKPARALVVTPGRRPRRAPSRSPCEGLALLGGRSWSGTPARPCRRVPPCIPRRNRHRLIFAAMWKFRPPASPDRRDKARPAR